MLPEFLYGTAWKVDQTADCVFTALEAGFRAVDTANQRKHYFEEGVGDGLARGYAELGLRREELFLQTKFTYAQGQDHRKPYDENAPYAEQVAASFASSLEHLRTDYLDSFVLHGPLEWQGKLQAGDRETWAAMERLHAGGRVRYLGISNVSLAQLRELCAGARVKPAFVQNRCYAEQTWDAEIRAFCRENGITYQGFSLLTANAKFLGGARVEVPGRTVPKMEFTGNVHPVIAKIQARTGREASEIVFAFARQIGMLPLTGSRSAEHLRRDLAAVRELRLLPEEMAAMEKIGA